MELKSLIDSSAGVGLGCSNCTFMELKFEQKTFCKLIDVF